MKPEINSKIEILESLRGFAALSVCLFHFVCTVTGLIENQYVLSFFQPGQYGVQLFFVISGFVIPWAMFHAGYRFSNFFSFFLKRLARLEPPYIISLVLALFILFLREQYFGKSNDHIDINSKQVLLHVGYLIPFFEGYKWLNAVYWTLAIEFQYYIFVALLYIPLMRASMGWRMIIYLFIGILSFISGTAFLPHWLPVFLLGILLFLFMSNHIGKKEYYSVSSFILCFCFYKYPFMSVFYTLVPLISVLWFKDKKIPGLHNAGKFSYSIYLIHPLIGTTFINVLSHYVDSAFEKFILIVGGIVITLISAWINYLVIEKRSKKLSSEIKYKN